MSEVTYLWRQGDGAAPEVEPPTSPVVCNAETNDDDDPFICDLWRGHDGPHAQWHFSTGELLAVWVDGDSELAAEG